jgi:predicted O-linked N-acetylglucosamine transferase (SPINDLY family)
MNPTLAAPPLESHSDVLMRAIGLQNEGRVDEAASLFNGLLADNPNNGAALYSICVIDLQRGNAAQALQLSSRGILLAPTFAPMHVVHAAILQALGRKEESLNSYDKGLALEPDSISALLNSGVLLRDMHRHKEAVERFNRVVAIDPNNAAGLANCAILLTEFKQSEAAIAMFKQLLAVNPDYDYGLGLLAYERLHICDWTDFEETRAQLLAGVRAGKRACKSLSIMAFSDSAEDHLASAKTFASHFCPKKSISLWNGERYRHDKIRIAYVSPDLREHPVGHLIAGVFERHDKSRFETVAISLGIDDQSRLRARMLKAFDRFVDVRGMGSQQIAQLMRDMEVDIAVDLGGYTSDTRTDVFAYRPAPVQVNYLGYPGSMGSDYYDYILADKQVIPVEQQGFYSEKVAYLPDAYLPTDHSVHISDRTPTRAECGLPEDAFVFCSFSHDYKITPPLFDIWMRLLNQVPGSVLWLMARGDLAQGNLRKEAAVRGVDPQRLVFAGRVPKVEDHLARYRQADLFLDTHPYNAHTTAADALMAGLPVLTYMGKAFPARVAGSLLTALEMPELIASTVGDYEARALHLATHPQALQILRTQVQAHVTSKFLFDTKAFCFGLEATFIAMWRMAQLGKSQDDLSKPMARDRSA